MAAVTVWSVLSANAEAAVAGECNAAKTASLSAKPHAAGVAGAPRFICPAHRIVVVQCWTRSDDKILLAVRTGTPVRAAGAGYVTYAGDFGRYGHVIIIRHPNGFASTYAHLGTFDVKRGDQVERGQVISTMAAEDGARGSEVLFQLVDRGKAVVQSRYVACHERRDFLSFWSSGAP